jgi:hypothetical protein
MSESGKVLVECIVHPQIPNEQSLFRFLGSCVPHHYHIVTIASTAVSYNNESQKEAQHRKSAVRWSLSLTGFSSSFL